MKWLVTGAYGFIGSNFARMLHEMGEDVQGIDCCTYAADIRNLENKIRCHHLDICNKEQVRLVLQSFQPDFVVNFAAESHVDNSINDSQPFIQSNIVGVSVLLDLAIDPELNFRLVQISTDEVYGSVEQQGKPFTEDMPLIPNSPYSASKASADLLVLSYVHTHKTNAVITRCSNNYGPYQHPEKMLPKAIICGFRSKNFPLYGDGMNVRDWIYVEDHCKGIFLAAVAGKSGEIYNFGGGNQITNREMVDKIFDGVYTSPELVEYVEDRKGHDRTYAVDCTKVLNKLGWKPEMEFNKGLECTVRWYEWNDDWWKEKI